MQYYFSYLKKLGFDVSYFEFGDDWIDEVKKENPNKISTFEPNDFELENKILKNFPSAKFIESPMFLCSKENFADFFREKNHFHQTSFYIYMRKKLNILLDENNKPIDGEWTFDKENRKKLPTGIVPPAPIKFKENKYVKEAKEYVEKNFPKNIGESDFFGYPTTFSEAKASFDDFIKNRFENFGTYQDSIKNDDSFLFHSVLSPSLNIGILTPDYVVQKALNQNVSLNSKEGFIRQIIGWREFVRGLYVLKNEELKNTNFWGFKKKLPKGSYSGETGILPIDNIIDKMLKTAYANHIERLMVLGNYFLLNEIDPNEVYRWFMEISIDSYDWVMTPNIFGMSQFAAGELMTTKPYICSSNYILKMSDFKKGDWCEKWDNLFHSFIKKHLDYLKTNPRMTLMLRNLAE